MLVLSLVVLHAHPRCGRTALLWGVVVTRPDFDMIWQAQQPAPRVKKIACTAARKIATSRAKVCVEERITTEYIV